MLVGFPQIQNRPTVQVEVQIQVAVHGLQLQEVAINLREVPIDHPPEVHIAQHGRPLPPQVRQVVVAGEDNNLFYNTYPNIYLNEKEFLISFTIRMLRTACPRHTSSANG